MAKLPVNKEQALNDLRSAELSLANKRQHLKQINVNISERMKENQQVKHDIIKLRQILQQQTATVKNCEEEINQVKIDRNRLEFSLDLLKAKHIKVHKPISIPENDKGTTINCPSSSEMLLLQNEIDSLENNLLQK